MQVVSNTSPIAVIVELGDAESPKVVRDWAGRPPDWVEVRIPNRELGWQLTHLGAGEKDAILLAEEIGADLLIIDERAGYTEAENRGLLVTGTLGVLEKAADLSLVNLTQAVSRLLATNFRIRRNIVETLLRRHESR
jgi:predicted nucleic acid-binding protein